MALLSSLVVVVLLQLLLFWLAVNAIPSYLASTAAGVAVLHAVKREKTRAKTTENIPKDPGPQPGNRLC